MTDVASSLSRALDRIEDFQAVQAGASPEELREAAELLQESVGVSEPERAVLRDHLRGIRGAARAPGHILLGFIVGLMATQGF